MNISAPSPSLNAYNRTNHTPVSVYRPTSTRFGRQAINLETRQPLSSYTPPLPEKEKMVAVLGASKVTPDTQPYLDILKDASKQLTQADYGVLTGGSQGANYYGNWGAVPERSFAIQVKSWDAVENSRPDSKKPLYNHYATVGNGPKRTRMFHQLCDTVVVSPGGAGSLEEIGVTLESMYYKLPEAPKKLILLGKDYWAPLIDLCKNMVRMGTADDNLLKCITVLDLPLHKPKQAVEQVVLAVTEPAPLQSTPHFSRHA